MLRRAPARWGTAAAVALVLAGCAPAPPPGVTASLVQPRTDVADHRMAIQVRNDGSGPVEVRAARLTSEVFTAPTAWTDDSATVHPGRALDLRVDIPPARCVEAPDPASVTLEFATGATIELEATDPYGLLTRFAAEACVAASIERIAALGPAELDVPGGARPAELVLPVRTTGERGSFTIVAALGTTLLQPAVDGIGVPEAPVGVVVEHGGPTELRIPLVPNRCDAHALAEDKIGTRIPLVVATDRIERGNYVVPAPPPLRERMYAFFSEYCGL